MQKRLSAIANENGDIIREYQYLGRTPVAILENGKIYSVHSDQLGTPYKVTDEKRNIIWAANYDPFGKAHIVKANIQVNLRFSGQYQDRESGTYYNYYRDYDPAQGRYLQADPMGISQGLNQYHYVNNNPVYATDPYGLFKVPTSVIVFGNLNARDSGSNHGTILRVAFAEFNFAHGGALFSNDIIEQIITNNFHTDALPLNTQIVSPYSSLATGVAGGGQYNTNNHFDNPNDGPEYIAQTNQQILQYGRIKSASYSDGSGDNWIQDGIDQLNRNRANYGAITPSNGGFDISRILNAFGQNTHALADFYAHMNWVDASNRGGCLTNVIHTVNGDVIEQGYVPIGLNQTRVWDEDFDSISITSIYSGTVQGGKAMGLSSQNTFCGSNLYGDIECGTDMTTHGYWNKDEDKLSPNENAYTQKEQNDFSKKKIYYWEQQTLHKKFFSSQLSYPPGKYGVDWYADGGKPLSQLKAGDRIYVGNTINNRHRLAYYLAIEATKREIEKLYNASSGINLGAITLQDVFKMDSTKLNNSKITYTNLFSKQ